ncbi:MAG: Holliday junction branch migration protein RuvA [Gammaproteobacteria bacterium]|nr:MAG: Holliday junction branch migration protein RuvA [Gammaproteobacteria bacterium]
MIGFLRGRLAGRRPPTLWLEVGGVGYELEAPMTTFYELPAEGSELVLHTHLVVREDAQTLYGFLHRRDRDLFRTLIRTSGVGPRLALAILSGMPTAEFVRCVQEGEARALTRIPGIGRKTAERLVVELRDRLGTREAAVAAGPAAAEGAGPGGDPVSEAVSALVALGYKPQEAGRMVQGITTEGLGTEEIIRQALQKAVKG